jgi:hypothetical protein
MAGPQWGAAPWEMLTVPQTTTADGEVLYGPFTHRTDNPSTVDKIISSQELQGKEGRFGSVAARAYLGPLDASAPAGQVEFFTKVPPVPTMHMGFPIVQWRAGTPGTTYDGSVVHLPIRTTNAKFPKAD